MLGRHDPQRPPARQLPVTSRTVAAPPAMAAAITALVTRSQWHTTTARTPPPADRAKAK